MCSVFISLPSFVLLKNINDFRFNREIYWETEVAVLIHILILAIGILSVHYYVILLFEKKFIFKMTHKDCSLKEIMSFYQIKKEMFLSGLLFPPIITLANNLKQKFPSVLLLAIPQILYWFEQFNAMLIFTMAKKSKNATAITSNSNCRKSFFSFEQSALFSMNLDLEFIRYLICCFVSSLVLLTLTSFILDYMGNYYNLYKLSCSRVHFSLLQDFLINEESLNSQMREESKRILDVAIKSDLNSFNHKDLCNGKSWFYLALALGRYDLINKVLDARGTILDEEFFDLLEEKQKETGRYEEEENDLCRLEKRIKRPNYRSTCPTMHVALEESNFCKLAFWTILGGLWDARNQQNQSLFDCIIEKIEHGEIDLFENVFFSKFFILHVRNINGESIAQISAMNGKTDCLRKLIEFDSKTVEKSTEKTRQAPLHLAVIHNQLECVRVLLEKNCNVNTKDFIHITPLHYAASKGFEELAKLLLSTNSDPNLKSKLKQTPLHMASRNNRTAIIKLLIENNAKVDLTDYKYQTALHLAIKAGHLESVSLLVQKGANLSFKTRKGLSPLHLAVKLERTEHVKFIIQCISKDVITRNDQSHINSSAEQDIKFEASCILNEKNMEGNSSLHVAAMTGNKEIIEILAENGADVNQTNFNWNTPLHLVLLNKSISDVVREEACIVLLKAKADFKKKNLKRKAPLDFPFLKSLQTRMPDLFEENDLTEITYSPGFHEQLGLPLWAGLRIAWWKVKHFLWRHFRTNHISNETKTYAYT